MHKSNVKIARSELLELWFQWFHNFESTFHSTTLAAPCQFPLSSFFHYQKRDSRRICRLAYVLSQSYDANPKCICKWSRSLWSQKKVSRLVLMSSYTWEKLHWTLKRQVQGSIILFSGKDKVRRGENRRNTCNLTPYGNFLHEPMAKIVFSKNNQSLCLVPGIWILRRRILGNSPSPSCSLFSPHFVAIFCF